MKFPVPTLRYSPYQLYLLSKFDKSKNAVQDFPSVWFIVSEQSLIEFSLVSSTSLKISSRVPTLATLSKPNF